MVLATPGTSSRRMWPSQKYATSARISCWRLPTMTFSTLAMILLATTAASDMHPSLSVLPRRLTADRLTTDQAGHFFQLVGQILGEIGALEEQQGKAGVHQVAVSRTQAHVPAAVRLLVEREDVQAPVIPVLAVDALKLVQHADALHRPQEVHLGARRRFLARVADVAAEALEGFLNVLVLAQLPRFVVD